jgi:hypothetical protein
MTTGARLVWTTTSRPFFSVSTFVPLAILGITAKAIMSASNVFIADILISSSERTESATLFSFRLEEEHSAMIVSLCGMCGEYQLRALYR